MSALKQFANWLGLGPDEADPYAEHIPVTGDPYSAPSRPPAPAAHPVGEQFSERATTPNAPYEFPQVDTAFPVRSTSGSPSGVGSTVRPLNYTDSVKPIVINPSSYEEAQEIGNQFKSRQPVIVNLEDADVDLRRRLVDFVSGLCYALDGKVKRVTLGVYLLTPSDMTVDVGESTS